MDLWSALWQAGGRYGWVAWPVLLLSLIALALWAPGLKYRWLRFAVRTLGAVVLLCLVAIVSLGALMSWGDPRPQHRSVTSPNGMYEATITYQAGFLGRDISRVDLRKRGARGHIAVYDYEGPSDLTSTGVKWVDNSHLEISYPADPARHQECSARAAEVIVICKKLAAGSEPE